MTTSTELQALAERFALVPGVGVGPLRFGDRLLDHGELLVPVEVEDDEDDEDDELAEYREYTVPGLEDGLTIYIDALGCVDSASFYEFCLVDGRDLIDMGVGQLLLELGAPEDIDAEEIGDEVELLYSYPQLGLTVWTSAGRVCVVQAGRIGK